MPRSAVRLCPSYGTWGEVVPSSSASGGDEVAVEWIASECCENRRINVQQGHGKYNWSTQPTMPFLTKVPEFGSPIHHITMPSHTPTSRISSLCGSKGATFHESSTSGTRSIRTNDLSPKTQEAVQDETKLRDGKPKNRQWFEVTMAVGPSPRGVAGS